ncbi:hypothetical protein [Azospirillum palustre]
MYILTKPPAFSFKAPLKPLRYRQPRQSSAENPGTHNFPSVRRHCDGPFDG